jgi:putative hydrolase of the HAD superfamily
MVPWALILATRRLWAFAERRRNKKRLTLRRFTTTLVGSKTPLRMATIKNILFDLGNVLLNLNLDKTEEAFRDLLQEEFEMAYLKYEADRLFEQLEVGKITPFEFIQGMRSAAEVPMSDDDIIDGWNALLGDLPMARIDYLKELSQDYNIYLLSNTNAIHIMWLNDYLREQYNMRIGDFTGLFQKHYFSFELRLRKPQKAIFEHVIQDAGIDPKVTLFVDDGKVNIQTAQQLGFQTYLHDPRMDITQSLPAKLS